MKNITIILLLFLVFFCSCKPVKDYSVEISYKVSGLKGDSILTKKETYFTAVNDSLAYLKGSGDFNKVSQQKIDSSGKPTKFSVKNKNGAIILPLSTNQPK